MPATLPVAARPFGRSEPLNARLAEVTDQVAGKRADAQTAWAAFEAARKRVGQDASDAALAAAERAKADYDTVAVELGELERKRDTIFSLLPGARTGQRVQLADRSQPGAWLSGVLQRHALTTEDIGSTDDTAAVFFDRFREASALMASGPTVVDLDTTSIKVPTLTDRLAPAPIVDELEEIPEVTVPLDLVEIRPPKLAQLTTLSKEAYTDARPVVLAANERGAGRLHRRRLRPRRVPR